MVESMIGMVEVVGIFIVLVVMFSFLATMFE